MSKLKRDGIVAALSKTSAYLGMRYTSKIRKTSIVNPAQAYEEPESHPKANSLFGNNVTLICESTLPQCFKYRVAQKADMLRMLGMTVDIIDWRQTADCLSSLQISAMAIFYRVPFYPSVQKIYSEVKRLDIPTFWEVDDLIFDAELYKSNTNMQALPVEIVKGLLEGAELYGSCLSASDFGIASTEKLQEIMSREKTTWVVENALDKQTVEIAKGLRREKKLVKQTKNTVDIMYGSGTKTHDIDFKEAEPAIISVLAKRANARFIVMGDLTVSKELETSSQFVRYPAADFKSYLRKLSMADISIAPLEASEFNEAKSNIKYLEASVLGLASVCTPTSPFENAIQHGENGYLARTFEEWEGSLLELVDNEEKRIEVAKNAYKFVYRNYSPFRIARRQLLPAVSHLLVEKKKKRILSANIYFYPRSFGGATIIAEQMISRLSNDEGIEHFVLTIDQEIDGPDYSLKRYKALGAEVIAIKTPIYRSNVDMLYDRKMLKIFRNILEATDPDLVHLHSIQGLGLALPEACRETGVPYTITVHDTWWLCGRQFMVNDRNEFCQQRRLDPVICSVCVSDAKFEIYRREMSRLALNNAIRILAPSQYIRNIYIANGVDSEKITLNKNGVREPNRNLNSDPRPLTFGYVGGKTEIKGWDMVVKAFNELSSAYDIRLAVVDNALNLGYRSIDKSEFINHDKVDVVPAYKQETIDDFFSTIDVLLFPTQAMESFGLTVREAQIRGKWVITTEAGGAIEDINDGVNGTVIPMAKNPKYLIEAMKEIIEEFSTKPPLVNPHIVTFAEQAEDLRLQYGELIR
ncbi:glycosyltransferase [Ochrobactrum sp. BTU1]|uniref:glycosyltransferase n=1 Tax=Ochrobactrum sp. BTU1 TaxID=2840456 RepID=UPI001C05265F|nr:glycosyltransferase [Ochrobactrum sp. BTU1]